MILQLVSPDELLALVGRFLWPFVRISALLMAAPMFGARTVPVRVRACLAVLLAIVASPQVAVPAGITPVSLSGALLVTREALIGTGMGFLLQLVFSAMVIGGEVIALSMGLAFASIVDPERGGSVPLVSQYFVLLSTLTFLAFDGHLALLAMLFESFQLLPPAASALGSDGFVGIVNWGSRMFETAILVALPATTALLVTSVAMGVIARSAPQLNIFAVGFPMTLMIGIAGMLFSLPLLVPQLESAVSAVLEQMQSVWSAWQ